MTQSKQLSTQEDLWCPVVQSYNLVRVEPHWHSEGSSQTEVSKFDDPFLVDEEIGRLQVSVHDPPLMAIQHTLQQQMCSFLYKYK